MKVHVFGFNMILLSSPERVPRPINPFRRNFGRSGKGSFTEKAKIVNVAFETIPRESTCVKLHYVPYLISVPSSHIELDMCRLSRAGRYGFVHGHV